MKIVIAKPAQKGLNKMPATARAALVAKLTAIAAAPFASHPFDVKAMKGEKDMFRIRQGDWRAVYVVLRIEDTIHVRIIDIRGEVYK
ncbi:type II toxin-antitoxin system RelE family toxin [Niveispirillum fermenti]|uniref:type II toxin-antitoxin system RelE family toxin n=1 Tax=Niveispirillum fermenti TaxID=1233113 RepID=UPI003A85626B